MAEQPWRPEQHTVLKGRAQCWPGTECRRLVHHEKCMACTSCFSSAVCSRVLLRGAMPHAAGRAGPTGAAWENLLASKRLWQAAPHRRSRAYGSTPMRRLTGICSAGSGECRSRSKGHRGAQGEWCMPGRGPALRCPARAGPAGSAGRQPGWSPRATRASIGQQRVAWPQSTPPMHPAAASENPPSCPARP